MKRKKRNYEKYILVGIIILVIVLSIIYYFSDIPNSNKGYSHGLNYIAEKAFNIFRNIEVYQKLFPYFLSK